MSSALHALHVCRRSSCLSCIVKSRSVYRVAGLALHCKWRGTGDGRSAMARLQLESKEPDVSSGRGAQNELCRHVSPHVPPSRSRLLILPIDKDVSRHDVEWLPKCLCRRCSQWQVQVHLPPLPHTRRNPCNRPALGSLHARSFRLDSNVGPLRAPRCSTRFRPCSIFSLELQSFAATHASSFPRPSPLTKTRPNVVLQDMTGPAFKDQDQDQDQD